MQGKRGKASVRKEVRQGCSLSPPLFNLYSEGAIHEIKDTKNIGVEVQGKIMKMLGFVDDIVLIANTEKGGVECNRDTF